MNIAEKYHFSDFTHSHYRKLLRSAKSKYRFLTYQDAAQSATGVFWRHDVDMSMHAALDLAEIEAGEKLTATYFLMLHSDFYNLLEREVSDIVRRIVGLGHRVGLHFDPGYYADFSPRNLPGLLSVEKNFLEAMFGISVDVFSFHNPNAESLSLTDFQYAGLVNTYSDFFQKKVAYCSDSNGYWRHSRLSDVLEQPTMNKLQVLTHPEWWVNEAMSPHARVERCIVGRSNSTRRKYAAILEAHGRQDIGKP
ncbi:hypothetical protein [Achromobacter dolens]|uniref:hypothetical protein n=1 Tax=Achromobacter dolens TaxID=1287738 RepID=UPI00300CD54F